MSKLSVIITTHERPRLLARAIASLKTQQDADIQVIVVSDTACAATHAVATGMLTGPDRFLVRADTRGPAASRNAGLRLADGDHVVFLDDDDAFTERFFCTLAPHLTDTDIVYTNYHVVLERVQGDEYVPLTAQHRPLGERAIADLYVKNFIPLHCLVYPRAVVERCTFDPTLPLNEDWEFLLAAAAQAPLRHVPIDGPIIYARERADNRGRSNDDLLETVYRRIYAQWPAPTPEIADARRRFFSQHNLQAA